MSTETAIELLEFDDDHSDMQVRIADAPVLEGSVSAAVSASAGDTLEEVIAAAEEARGMKKLSN
jgi:dihydroxyacetone kinase DhaKLM complex PTS-EIIA-like component DhaM